MAQVSQAKLTYVDPSKKAAMKGTRQALGAPLLQPCMIGSSLVKHSFQLPGDSIASQQQATPAAAV